MTKLFWNPIAQRYEPIGENSLDIYPDHRGRILNVNNESGLPAISGELIEAKKEVETFRIISENEIQLARIDAEKDISFLRDCNDAAKTWLVSRNKREKRFTASKYEKGFIFMKEKIRLKITIK